MDSLNDTLLSFFVRFSTYLLPLLAFMHKLILSAPVVVCRLKGSPESKSNLEAAQQIIGTMIDSADIGLHKEADASFLNPNKEEPQSFLSFKFQKYEEFIDSVNPEKVVVGDHAEADGFSGSSSDEEWFEPSNEPPLLQDSDGDDDPIPSVCLKAESLKGEDSEVLKPEKVGDHWDGKPFGDGFEAFLESDLESVLSSSNFSLRSSLLGSIKDGYLSSASSSSEDEEDDDDEKVDEFEDEKADEFDDDDEKVDEFDDDDDEKVDEFNIQSPQLSQEEAEYQELSRGYETEDIDEDEDLLGELKGIEREVVKEKRAKEYSKFREESSPDEGEVNGMETQWEHQNLIEQLKMEIGKVKAIGLPTIFEDSENPKMAEDLKPWKIDEKLFRTGGGTMDEVHKFYKSYREKMRKFDIFNYQKMYAIGFLRLKDPLQSFSSQKISLATIVSQDCWPCKPKASGTSNYSVVKFTRELESDLETVYVGQLCLSWEFLRWEYGKALAVWDSDPREVRRFHKVAGEFQQFQVLLQRFLEEEPFRSSGRVQNYVKNRCINRHLLQVPVIKEDSAKDKMKQIKPEITSKDAVTSVIVIEMIEESIRLIWQLIRTDRDSTTTRALNPRKAAQVDLQNPDDATLLLQVQETLRMKHKKLKELRRSECCILRKLQRKQSKQNYAGRVLCFFSEVDMKLVSRVLNMARLTTDQLAWCCSKLDNIEFVDNRIKRDPSFFLFPCS